MRKVKLSTVPMAETPRHGDIVADTENVLQTVFVYINENNSCCFPLAALHTGMKAFRL